MEPDKNHRKTDVRILPRRTRFYHALIDVRELKTGVGYGNLKNVTVIIISDYDPLGRDRMVYTVRNTCVEEPDIPFEDGMRTLFLYTRGTKDKPPQELKALLRYFGDTRPENAVNGTLKELQKMVNTVKSDEEVSVRYMKIFEREQMIREEGYDEGHDKGFSEGHDKGYNEGNLDRLREQIRKKLSKNKSLETIADELEEDDVDLIRQLAAEIMSKNAV